jgi:hypothetical protein
MGRLSQQFGNYGFDKIQNHVRNSSSLEQTQKTTMLQCWKDVLYEWMGGH